MAAFLVSASTYPAVPEPRGIYFGTYAWDEGGGEFGEFSGLHMADSQHFVTVSDLGRIAAGRFLRDDQDRISGVELDTQLIHLRDSDGQRLRARMRDAEAVAIAPDGRIFVAFEQVHRVWLYDQMDGPARPLPLHPDFRRFPANQGLEALAVLPDGTLLAVPELPPPGMGEHPVYRYREGAWDMPYTLTRDWAFWPVGADVGPDGLFYLLERDFLPILGFRSRVRRFVLSDQGPIGGEVLFVSRRGDHGNLEGLSVWRDSEEKIRLTMISDNNRWPGVSTEIVEYQVAD